MISSVPIVLSFVFGAMFLLLILLVALCSCLGKLNIKGRTESEIGFAKPANGMSPHCVISCERLSTPCVPTQNAVWGPRAPFESGHLKQPQNLKQQHHIDGVHGRHQDGCHGPRHYAEPTLTSHLKLAAPHPRDSPPSYLESISTPPTAHPAHEGL